MRKTLIIAILALFGSETLAQHGFRPLTRPGNPPPFNPSPFNPNSGRPVLLDAEDNEMVAMRPPLGQGPLINRPPVPTHTFDDVEDNEMVAMRPPLGQGPLINRPQPPRMNFDDVEDNEMALNLNSQGAVRDAVRLSNNDYRVKVGRWDDSQDDELFAEDDELFTQGDMGRMGGFLGNGNSGLVAGGGSTRGGIAWGGAGQYAHNIGKNTQVIGGASFGHAPGSRVGINPHVGVKFSFDDEANDELFVAEDDDEFFGVPLGNGGSGVFATGGSTRGGLSWGGVGQYSHNIGRNTQLIGGATISHAPGSKVNIAPHVGIRHSFDDDEN